LGTLDFIRSNLRWLGAGFLLKFSSCFGQTFFISIFAGYIQAAFGLSHGEWGSIYMYGTLASAIVMVWAGVSTDIFRVRSLGSCVMICLALSCIAMALVSQAWALILIIFALRFFGQGMSSHIASTGLARWFSATRGRAIAIASLGFSIGEALLPMIFVALIALIGWRGSWFVSAAILVALLPVLSKLLAEERTPKEAVLEKASFGMGMRHWSRPDVLRHRLFWLLLPSLLAPSAFGTAFFFWQVHIAETKGWTHLEMVSLFPVYTVTAVCVMLLSGLAIDRFGTRWIMPLHTLPIALGFLIFAGTDTIFIGALGIMFFAATSGMQATLPAALWAEFYGTENIGSIKALSTSIMVLGSAIGPGLTGWLIDGGLNFQDQISAISTVFLITTVLAGIGIWSCRSDLATTP